MKLIVFAIIPLVAILSAIGTLIYYAIRKRAFVEMRKEKRIKRDYEQGKLSEEEANAELSKLKKYKKKQKEQKPLTKSQKKKRLAFQIVAMIMVVVVGAIGGFFAGSFYISSKYRAEYNFSEAQYRDNVEVVLKQTINNPNEYKRPNEGVGAINAFVTAEYVLSQKNTYQVNSNGTIQPSIGSKQSVYAYRYKKDNVTYLENISVGMLSVAERLIYKDNVINRVEGKSIQTTNADWTGAISTFSYDQFKEINGNAIDNPIAYVVSSKTATVETNNPKELGGGLYQFKLVLSTDTSVMNYVKQMKRTSGLSSYPKFESVVLTFTIDEDYNFIEITAEESYTVVYFGVPAFCSGSLTQRFNYDENFEIKH